MLKFTDFILEKKNESFLVEITDNNVKGKTWRFTLDSKILNILEDLEHETEQITAMWDDDGSNDKMDKEDLKNLKEFLQSVYGSKFSEIEAKYFKKIFK